MGFIDAEPMPEPTYIDRGATFDAARVFRYRLWRVWDAAKPRVAFLLLNPSTADERVLDPTLRRCLGYARAWGFGSLEVGNVFALRSTDPRALVSAADPVGPGNDAALVSLAAHAELVVCGWGAHGALLGRDRAVLDLLEAHSALHALRLTRTGAPGHPLYLPASLRPVPFRPRRVAARRARAAPRRDRPWRPSMVTRRYGLSGALVVLSLIGALLPAVSHAQQNAGTLKEQIVGTWTPTSQYVDQDGKKLEPFGSRPKGMAVYDENGRFVFVIQRATLPKIASSNRLTGTADENRAIVQGSIAYFGRYSVDEKERTIHLHFDGSTYPNWDGEDQTRSIAISGDELTIISPVSAVGGGSVHVVLRRAK